MCEEREVTPHPIAVKYGGYIRAMERFVRENGLPDEIISGCAKGPDTLGIRWALEHGVPVRKFPAKWKIWGKSAGFVRNEEMANEGTHLLALWDGESSGTRHMIECARRKGLFVQPSFAKVSE